MALPGNIAVHQMYVEYQIPQVRKYKYPIVFMHGGGHTGEFFRRAPDGRQGWFTSFTGVASPFTQSMEPIAAELAGIRPRDLLPLRDL